MRFHPQNMFTIPRSVESSLLINQQSSALGTDLIEDEELVWSCRDLHREFSKVHSTAGGIFYSFSFDLYRVHMSGRSKMAHFNTKKIAFPLGWTSTKAHTLKHLMFVSNMAETGKNVCSYYNDLSWAIQFHRRSVASVWSWSIFDVVLKQFMYKVKETFWEIQMLRRQSKINGSLNT